MSNLPALNTQQVQPVDGDALAAHHPELSAQSDRLVWVVIALMGIAIPLLALFIYMREGMSGLLLPVIGMGIAAGISAALLKKGQSPQAIRVLLYAMYLGSMFGAYAHGSARSSAVLGVMGAVIGAGIFLSTREIIGIGIVTLSALGALNWLEWRNLLAPANLEAGLIPWLVQALVLSILLIGIYMGRRHLTSLIAQLEASAVKAQRLSKQLRTSEARAQALLRRNPLASVVQDPSTFVILDVNDAFLDLFNARRDDLVGNIPPTLFGDVADARRFQSLMRKNGRVSGMNALGTRLDGTTFDGQVFSDQIILEDENLLLTMVLDVTEHQKAIRALVRSEERFSKAVNGSPMGMIIVRISNDKVIEANAAQAAVLGHAKPDILGVASSKVLNWVHDMERTRFWQEMRSAGQVKHFNASLWNKGGQRIEGSIWANLIEIEGESCALIHIMNVTEDRRREQKLIELAKGISSETGELFFHTLVARLASSLDADMVLAGELLDEDTVQSVAVHQDGNAAPNFQYALSVTPCSHTMKTVGGCYTSVDLQKDFPNPSRAFSAYIGVPLRDNDGKDIGILKALWKDPREISEDIEAMMTIFATRCNAELIRLRQDRAILLLRETLEQRVVERTEQLEDLNNELDSFAYSVSHDLKTPLRSIEGFMHLLREQTEGRLNATEIDLMRKVTGASNRMAQLIRDLLALARVSQTEIKRARVDISVMAHEVVARVRETDPYREVDVRIADSLIIECDPQLARIALENLIGNAWKYTRLTQEARIDMGSIDSDTGSTTLFIKDNGAGFDMARTERLFKAFNRLHGANEFEGSGIGLATVRRIMDRHGGHIRGEGKVSEGATFQFSFGVSDLVWPALAPAVKGAVADESI